MALAGADLQTIMEDALESVAGVVESEYSRFWNYSPGGRNCS